MRGLAAGRDRMRVAQNDVETDAAQKLQALATERGVDLTAAP